VRLEGLGQLKKSNDGIEPATFRLVAWCLNQLRYRVPPWEEQITNENAERLWCCQGAQNT
jgi:hypothetical protein